jgi:hypothetical protein
MSTYFELLKNEFHEIYTTIKLLIDAVKHLQAEIQHLRIRVDALEQEDE